MSVKMKYNFLYFLCCVVGCCFSGFVAVFLQWKGVSNTLIGLVTAIGCVASIPLAPFLSSYVSNSKTLNPIKMIEISYISLGAVYAAIMLLPLPPVLVMALYAIMYSLFLSCSPFFQMVASDYMQAGIEVNFGLARGLGSAAWAISALVFGRLVDMFSPMVLIFGYIGFCAIMIGLLMSMPKVDKVKQTGGKKSGSLFDILRKYKVFSVALLGFSLMLCGATSLGTYLINIVKSLGGTTSFYGVAVFIMALSELPVMALVPTMMKKVKSVNLLAIAGICYLLRNVLICLAPNLLIMCCGMILQGFSFGLTSAVVTYYVIYNLNPEDQAMGQTSIIVCTSGAGSMIGNLLGGVLQDTFGLSAMYTFVIVVTLIGAVIINYARILAKKEQYALEVKR